MELAYLEAGGPELSLGCGRLELLGHRSASLLLVVEFCLKLYHHILQFCKDCGNGEFGLVPLSRRIWETSLVHVVDRDLVVSHHHLVLRFYVLEVREFSMSPPSSAKL